MLYVMKVDGKGFPSFDLTRIAFPIGEKIFGSPSLKIAREETYKHCVSKCVG